MRRIALLTLALTLALTGCGNDGGKETGAAAGASSSSAAAPTTASDPYDVYEKNLTAHGITPSVKRGEAVGVAGNTCDNTVADMEGLVTTMKTLYPATAEYADFLADRAYFIDAYCPDARVVFDAATQDAAGVVIPAA